MVRVLGFAKTTCTTVSTVGPYVDRIAKMELVTRKRNIVIHVCKVFMVQSVHYDAMGIVSKIHVDEVMGIVHTPAQNDITVQPAHRYVAFTVATVAIDRQASAMLAQLVVMATFVIIHAAVLVHPVSVKNRMEIVLVHVSQNIMAINVLLSVAPPVQLAVTEQQHIVLATAYLDTMVTFAKWTVALDVLVKSALEVMGSAEVAAKLDTGVCSVTTPVNLVTLMDAFRITEHVHPSACLVSTEQTVHKTVV